MQALTKDKEGTVRNAVGRALELVKNGHWNEIIKLLQNGLNSRDRQILIKEVMKYVQNNIIKFRDYEITTVLSLCIRKQRTQVFCLCVRRGLWSMVVDFLKRGVSRYYRRWAIQEAARKAQATDLLLLAPVCTHVELTGLIINVAVHDGLWEVAGHVLEAAHYQKLALCTLMSKLFATVDTSQPRAEFYQLLLRQTVTVNKELATSSLEDLSTTKVVLSSADKYRALRSLVNTATEEVIIKYCVQFCKTFNFLLRVIVNRGMTNAMLSTLDIGLSPDQRRAVITAYCSTESDEDVSSILVPRCSMYERNFVIIIAMDRHFYKTIKTILQRGLLEHLCRWTIRTAATEGNVVLLNEIVSVDLEVHLSSVVTSLLAEKQGNAACSILIAALNTQTYRWAVQMVKQMKWAELKTICISLTEATMKDLLKSFIKHNLWRPVGQLLALPNSQSLKSTFMHECTEHCGEQFIRHFILPICTGDEDKKRLIDACVQRELWNCVKDILLRETAPEQYADVFLKLVKFAEESLIYDVLVNSSDDQCNIVLDIICKRGLIIVLIYLCLQRGCVLTPKHEEALKAGISLIPEDFLVDLCPVLPESLVSIVAFAAANRGMWRCVSKLYCQVADAEKQIIIDQACLQAREPQFIQCMVPLFKTNDFEEKLPVLINRGFWLAVDRLMLNIEVSVNNQQLIANKAVRRCNCPRVLIRILSRCTDLDVVSTLKNITHRDMWAVAGHILDNFKVSERELAWVISEACKRAVEESIINYILPRCTQNEHFETVLTAAVRRKLWKLLKDIVTLKKDLCLKNWAFKEALKNADDRNLNRYIIPLYEVQFSECFVKELIRRGLIKTAKVYLNKEVFTDSLWNWILRKILKIKNPHNLVQLTAPLLNIQQKEELLRAAVERNGWNLCSALTNMDTTLLHWAVGEAGQRASEKDILLYVMGMCSFQDMEELLDQAVRRSLWEVVDGILKRGVGTEKCVQVVTEACSRADEFELVSFILPHCTSDMSEKLIKILVSRCKWEAVGVLLELDLSEETRIWAVGMALRHASDQQQAGLIPFCATSQVTDLLKCSTKKGMWSVACQLLQRCQDDEAKDKAKAEIYSRATERDIVNFCLPHRTELEHSTFVECLVKNNMWRVVGILFHWGEADLNLDDDEREKHLSAAMKSLHNHLTKENFSLDVQVIVKKRMYRALKILLSVGIHYQSLREFVLQEAAKHCPGPDFNAYILKDLTNEERDITASIASKNSQWDIALGLLRVGISERERSIVVRKAAKHCNNIQILQEILEFARDAQRWETIRLLFGNDHADIALNILRLTRVTAGDLIFSWSWYCSAIIAHKWLIETSSLANHSAIRLDQVQTLVKLEKVCKMLIDSTQDENISCEKWENASLEVYDVEVTRPFLEMFTHYANLHQWGRRADDYISDKELLLALIITPILLCNEELNGYKTLIKHVCKIYLRERLLRLLFTNAIEKEAGDVLYLISNICLYDDQRISALSRAWKSSNWRFLLLALYLNNHLLCESERHVISLQVIKEADWDTIVDILKLNLNVRTIIKLLEQDIDILGNTKKRTDLMEKKDQLITLEKSIVHQARNLSRAIQRSNWLPVFHTLQTRHVSHEVLTQAVLEAEKSEEWDVLNELLMLNVCANIKNGLMNRMVNVKNWHLVRTLLDVGVKGRDHLPQLLEADQWFLAAIVAETELSSMEKVCVIKEAMTHNEESCVFQILSTMNNPLSYDERHTLFEMAIRQKMWRIVVKLLQAELEEGPSHAQCVTAVEFALQNKRWDIVNACLKVAARYGQLDCFATVVRQNCDITGSELLLRYDIPLFDEDSNVHMFDAISNGHWDIVKRMIEFHSGINLLDSSSATVSSDSGGSPLQKFIEYKKADLIDIAILWGHDIAVSALEEKTALHAVCEAGLVESLKYCVGRGCDPLAVSKDGETTLMLAVANKHSPHKLLAECIKLGMSTFQPNLCNTDKFMNSSNMSEIRSPFVFALKEYDITLMHMLYESGACTNKELHHHLNDHVLNRKESLIHSKKGKQWAIKTRAVFRYLAKVARSPRSLTSLCRLTISHQLGASNKYRRRVERLPLCPHLKNYVLFSDVLDCKPSEAVNQITNFENVEERFEDVETAMKDMLSFEVSHDRSYSCRTGDEEDEGSTSSVYYPTPDHTPSESDSSGNGDFIGDLQVDARYHSNLSQSPNGSPPPRPPRGEQTRTSARLSAGHHSQAHARRSQRARLSPRTVQTPSAIRQRTISHCQANEEGPLVVRLSRPRSADYHTPPALPPRSHKPPALPPRRDSIIYINVQQGLYAGSMPLYTQSVEDDEELAECETFPLCT